MLTKLASNDELFGELPVSVPTDRLCQEAPQVEPQCRASPADDHKPG